MIQHTNMYLCLTTEAYQTVPVREVTDDDGTVTGTLTLKDIFPAAPKFPLSNRVLVGVEFQGAEVPTLIETCEAMGFAVSWGLDDLCDVQIIGIELAKTCKAELDTFEAAHFLDEYGAVQVKPVDEALL